MDPFQSLAHFKNKYKEEDERIGKEVEAIETEVRTAQQELLKAEEAVTAARLRMEKVSEKKNDKMAYRRMRKEQHQKALDEIRKACGEPEAKVAKTSDNPQPTTDGNGGQAERDEKKGKKYSMIAAFEASKKPLKTKEEVKKGLMEIRWTAQQFQNRTGLGEKKCRALAKKDLAKACPQTMIVLTQLLNELEAEPAATTVTQPRTLAQPTPNPAQPPHSPEAVRNPRNNRVFLESSDESTDEDDENDNVKREMSDDD